MLGAGAPTGGYFPFEEVSVKKSDHPGQPNKTERDEHDSVIGMAKYDFEPGVSDYSMLNHFRGITFMAYIIWTRFGCCPELWTRYWLCTDATICHRTYGGKLPTNPSR